MPIESPNMLRAYLGAEQIKSIRNKNALAGRMLERDQERQQARGQMATAYGAEGAAGLKPFASQYPDIAKQMIEVNNSIGDAERDGITRQMQAGARLALTHLRLSPEEQSQQWPAFREQWTQAGFDDANDPTPEQPAPGWLESQVDEAMTWDQIVEQRKGGPGFTLSPGQQRFGPGGEPLASLPPETEGRDPEKIYGQEAGLRKEFAAATKDFVKVRDSFGRVQASVSDPSAAGDLALIFNFMKILDPGSVVRESEFATAQNAAGVTEQIRALWNKLRRGERMAPKQRADFVSRAGKLYESQLGQYQRIEERYRRLAGQYEGVDPNRVVYDMTGGLDENAPPEIPSGSRQVGTFQGKPVYETPDGRRLVAE